VSLILDALRKADADRGRGAVPDLHAQPVLPQPPQEPAPAPGWRWAAAGAAAALAIAVALWLLARHAAEPGARDTQTTSAGAPPATAAAAPAQQTSAPGADPAPPRADPAPWPPPAARSPDRAGAPQAASAPAEAAPALVGAQRLPEALRAQLPPLALGGSIYSSNPASRSLIVNGRLHRESEFVAPGLRLEQIKPQGAVFDFNGHRFELPL